MATISTRNYPYTPVRYDSPTIWTINRVETGAEPVSLADMKDWLRVDFDADDAVITGLIKSARAGIEMFCNISIITQTVTMVADWYGEWRLPYGPVISVISVDYRVNNEYEAQVLNTGYWVDIDRLTVTQGRCRVVYEAGYTVVPFDLVTDIKRVVAYLYEHRGDEALSSLQGGVDRPKGIDGAMELFCKKHRVLWP